MFTSKADLKETIKKYVENNNWSAEDLRQVKQLVRCFPNRTTALVCCTISDVPEVEKLRNVLIEILNDYDILITKNNISFQQREKTTWWKENYGWVIGIVTAICAAIGVLIKLFEKLFD